MASPSKHTGCCACEVVQRDCCGAYHTAFVPGLLRPYEQDVEFFMSLNFHFASIVHAMQKAHVQFCQHTVFL